MGASEGIEGRIGWKSNEMYVFFYRVILLIILDDYDFLQTNNPFDGIHGTRALCLVTFSERFIYVECM